MYLHIDKSSTIPMFIQISSSLADNIRQGILKKGQQIPTTRALANSIGVHRKTVVAAYNELSNQGWIEMIPRKGTFIRHMLPEIEPLTLGHEKPSNAYPHKTGFSFKIDMFHPYPPDLKGNVKHVAINDGFPDVRLAPVTLLLREMQSLASRGAYKGYLNYGNAAGHPPLRQAIAAFLRKTRHLEITEENVMVTRGAQMGIYLSAAIILRSGDNVLVGEPNYYTANHTYHRLGARLNRIPVDDCGIDVEIIESICKKRSVKLVYVVPHHHHPTTVTLSAARRLKLLELADRYGFAIVEDDYDYDFHYNGKPILPLASIDRNGSVVYIGTLSKTVAPSIRTGFMVAPKNFIEEACKLRRLLDRQGDMLAEAAIAALFDNGTVARHIKKSLKVYRERRDFFCSLLGEELKEAVSFVMPEGGMSVWTTFRDKLAKVRIEAMKKGLELPDPSRYNTHKTDYNAIRIGFASLNLNEQEFAVSTLRKILR